MTILFGESVRRLRREKGLTQEQLSARLNVSFQTISKWERGESCPDITMLPVLAGFFGITTDELLGIDRAENERQIQALMDRYRQNTIFRTSEEMPEYLAPLREMLRHNPGDYRLWSFYFGLLTSLNRDTAESLRARLPEIRSVYEMILESCTNDALRVEVKGSMCSFYDYLIHKDPEGSEKEQALLNGIIDELPSMFDSREYTRTCSGSPKTDEEHRADCHAAIKETLTMLHHIVGHMDWEDLACKRCLIAILDAAYPDGDYGELSGFVLSKWEQLAVMSAQAGDFDEAFAALEKAIEIARRHDAWPEKLTHTSPLLRGCIFEKQPGASAMQGLRGVLNEEVRDGRYAYPAEPPWWPEGFRADARFGALLERVGQGRRASRPK